MKLKHATRLPTLFFATVPLLTMACSDSDSGSDGPDTNVLSVVHELGDATAGQDVFRFAAFGNERFWTDAMSLQQGLIANDDMIEFLRSLDAGS